MSNSTKSIHSFRTCSSSRITLNSDKIVAAGQEDAAMGCCCSCCRKEVVFTDVEKATGMDTKEVNT